MQTNTGRKITLTLLAAVLLLLISTATIFAEGETPPEETPTVEESPPAETLPPAEEPPTEELPTETETLADPPVESEFAVPAADSPVGETPPVEEVVVETELPLVPAIMGSCAGSRMITIFTCSRFHRMPITRSTKW